MAEITDLRGGMNDTDPPSALPDGQCVLAENVEFVKSTVGERRTGTSVVDRSESIDVNASAMFLYRHLPTNDESASELWTLFRVSTTATWWRKGTAWEEVTLHASAPTPTAANAGEAQAQTLHGKLFLAYKSNKNRLAVFDGTSIRVAGLSAPVLDISDIADDGSGGISGTRYYRVRFTTQAAGVTLRRSEPSESVEFTPSGSGSAVEVTRPDLVTEGETHWELEVSFDDANFYVVATTAVATTTASDIWMNASLLALHNPLSEPIGDYLPLSSGRYLAADQDRLIVAGSWEDTEQMSRVRWTPVLKDPGVGNDERLPLSTDNFIDLDGFDGGPITGISGSVHGYMYVFKLGAIYKLVRTGSRANAYEAYCLTKDRGALSGSVVTATDHAGNPVVYFLDRRVGPCVLGAHGVALQTCGSDIKNLWETVDTQVSPVAYYDPGKRQVVWWVSDSTTGTTRQRGLVLHTRYMRSTADGARGGWATFFTSFWITAACLFSDNVDTADPRSATLVPILGDVTRLLRTGVGSTDGGLPYTARLVTRPYILGGLLNKVGVLATVVLGKASSGANIALKLIRDFGVESKTVDISFTPAAGEGAQVVRRADNLNMRDAHALQLEIADGTAPGLWEVNRIAVKVTKEQTS